MNISLETLSQRLVSLDVLRVNLNKAISDRNSWIMPPEGHEAHRFVAECVRHHQDRIDAIEALIASYPERRAAHDLAIEAQRDQLRTSAARANPELTCGRCDGKGKIRGFGHIENGTCFACGGHGIRKQRRAA